MTGMNGAIGTRYRLEGLIDHSERGLILRVNDGNVWALDADEHSARHLGRRVIMEGVRSGLDRIDVDWIGEATGD